MASFADYYPPFWQFNGHVQTIFPSLFRKIPVPYQRERVELPDGDFLDLDWALVNNSKRTNKLVVVTHGLEGDSERHYVTGVIRKFFDNGIDGLGWNSRSCSGEINRLPRFYHHGDAEDLRFVVHHAIEKYGYNEIYLVGFSMGGSLTLRFLGEKPALLPKEVKKAVVASVPLDLPTSVAELYKKGKRFYMERFIKKLGVKIKQKSEIFPENPLLSYEGYEKIKNFEEFDNRYTAPLHGYADAPSFYEAASAKPLLPFIAIPTLIIQAKNDPFLSKECLDLGDGVSNKNLTLELPNKGGHVGFMQPRSKESYVEQRGFEFVEE